MFFPRLKKDGRPSVNLTREELAQLYDDAIMPVARQVIPETIHAWPASFAVAQFRDRKDATRFSNSSLLIPADKVDQFDSLLREHINSTDHLKWARQFFWGTEIRGVKDICCHAMDSNPGEKDAGLHHGDGGHQPGW
jgi:hypothetical protein